MQNSHTWVLVDTHPPIYLSAIIPLIVYSEDRYTLTTGLMADYPLQWPQDPTLLIKAEQVYRSLVFQLDMIQYCSTTTKSPSLASHSEVLYPYISAVT